MKCPTKYIVATLVVLLAISAFPISAICAEGEGGGPGEETVDTVIDYSETPTINAISDISFTYTGARSTIYLYDFSVTFTNYHDEYPDMLPEIKDKISFQWLTNEGEPLEGEGSTPDIYGNYLLGPYSVGNYILRMTYHHDLEGNENENRTSIEVSKESNISITTQNFSQITTRSEFLDYGEIKNGFGIDRVSYNYAIIAKVPSIVDGETTYDYYVMGYDTARYPADGEIDRFTAIPIVPNEDGSITLDAFDGGYRHALTFDPDLTSFYTGTDGTITENKLWTFGTGLWGTGNMLLSGLTLDLGEYSGKEHGIIVRFNGETHNSADDGSVILYNTDRGSTNALHLMKDGDNVFFSGDGDDATKGYTVYPVFLYREIYVSNLIGYEYTGEDLSKEYDGQPVIIQPHTITTPDGYLDDLYSKYHMMIRLYYTSGEDKIEFSFDDDTHLFTGPTEVGSYGIILEKNDGSDNWMPVLEGYFHITDKGKPAECEHDYKVVSATDPSCTESGSIQYECSKCYVTYSESIPALGHDLGEPMADDDDTHTSSCSRCDFVSKVNHIYDDGSETTVNGNSVMRYTCSECDHHRDVNIYTVSFECNGGTPCDPIKVPSEGIALLPNTTKAGYEFSGWFMDGSFETPAIGPITVTENKVLYAKWTIEEYDITYILDLAGADNGDNPIKYTVETETIILKPASSTEKTFGGWMNGDQIWTTIPKGTTGNLQFVAKWNDPTYTINFVTNGGSACDPITVTNGGQYTLPTSVRTGYYMSGWFSDEGLTQLIPFSGTFQGNGDVTYYAAWIKEQPRPPVDPKPDIPPGPTITDPVTDVTPGDDGSTTTTTTTVIEDGDSTITIIEEERTDSEGNTISSGSSANADIPTTTTTDDQGNTTSTVPGDVVDSILQTISENAPEGTIVTISVDATTTGTVMIDQEPVQGITDAGAHVSVTFGCGSIDIPSEVLSSVGQNGGSISISMESVEASNLPENQRDAASGGAAYTFTATANGDQVHMLGGTVTVTVSFTVPEGVDPQDIAAYYVDDEGNMEYIGGHYEDGKFIFDTDHFSCYVIREKVVEESKDNTMLIVGAAIAIIAVIAIAAVFINRNH